MSFDDIMAKGLELARSDFDQEMTEFIDMLDGGREVVARGLVGILGEIMAGDVERVRRLDDTSTAMLARLGCIGLVTVFQAYVDRQKSAD